MGETRGEQDIRYRQTPQHLHDPYVNRVLCIVCYVLCVMCCVLKLEELVKSRVHNCWYKQKQFMMSQRSLSTFTTSLSLCKLSMNVFEDVHHVSDHSHKKWLCMVHFPNSVHPWMGAIWETCHMRPSFVELIRSLIDVLENVHAWLAETQRRCKCG